MINQNVAPYDDESPEAIPEEGVSDIIDSLADNEPNLSKLVENVTKNILKVKESHLKTQESFYSFAKHNIRLGVIAVIVIITGLFGLTYLGKIDGAVLTFSLGVILGYLLSFMARFSQMPK